MEILGVRLNKLKKENIHYMYETIGNSGTDWMFDDIKDILCDNGIVVVSNKKFVYFIATYWKIYRWNDKV